MITGYVKKLENVTPNREKHWSQKKNHKVTGICDEEEQNEAEADDENSE